MVHSGLSFKTSIIQQNNSPASILTFLNDFLFYILILARSSSLCPETFFVFNHSCGHIISSILLQSFICSCQRTVFPKFINTFPEVAFWHPLQYWFVMYTVTLLTFGASHNSFSSHLEYCSNTKLNNQLLEKNAVLRIPPARNEAGISTLLNQLQTFASFPEILAYSSDKY